MRLTSHVSCLALLAVILMTGAAGAQEGLGDPTQPTALNERIAAPAKPAVTGPRWRLQSTLLGEDRRLAVINGKTLRVGEAIDGATLREVRNDGVILEYQGVRMNILLLPGTARVKRAGG